MTDIGHNSDPTGRLKEFTDRLEALETDKKAIADDIKDVKTEAKAAGLDVRAASVVVKQRMENEKKRQARVALEEQVDQYKHVLKMLD